MFLNGKFDISQDSLTLIVILPIDKQIAFTLGTIIFVLKIGKRFNKFDAKSQDSVS